MRLAARACFIFGILALASGLTSLGAAEPRPNLLLITIDTLRPDRLGCYGSPYLKTPTIDKWAASGVVFSRAFAHTPLTLPSHANILLGTMPLVHGVHDNGIFMVPEDLPDLATFLKQNGYATGAFIGAFPLDSRFGLGRGFDVYDESYGSGTSMMDINFVERKAEAVVGSALAWLDGRPGPWFAWIHCFDPHQPYEPPEPFLTRFKNDPYSGEVAYVDAALAKLFGFLEDSRQAGRTVVVFTGDHGQSLGEHGEATHGYFAYNSTLWVPLIISGPGFKPGRVEENVCHIDIFPTVCDLLGLDRPDFLQGRSLLAAMQGQDLASLASRPIYFESLSAYYRRGLAPLRGFIEGSKKFVDLPIPEIYDLKADFGEAHNLAGKDVARERAELAALIKSESGRGTAPKAQLRAEDSEKLRSLGYLTGFKPPAKTNFGPAEDLKTLLPYYRKFEDAQACYSRGETDRSIGLLKELIQGLPDFDNAYLFLVAVYEKQHRLSDAEAVLKTGAEANPRSYFLALGYGMLLAQVGRYDEALRVLEKALGIIDWDPELWNYLGVAYWNKGDPDHAVAAYEHAISLDPKYSAALSNLGTAETVQAMKSNDAAPLRRAMDHFKQAIGSDPRDPAAYNGLGGVYGMLGDFDAAITCWEQAVAIDPGHQLALYNLGTAYLRKGDKANARKYLTKYKELFYASLPPDERTALDALLEKCR
jgi:arylsulfatase A-like enzyme/Flp pilus assembly protein TadD